MPDLLGFSLEELTGAVVALGQPGYRAKQIFHWLQARGARSFDEMTELPRALRECLREHYQLAPCEMADKRVSPDGTVKFLFRLGDGETVESVWMRYSYGNTICVSCQAGCRMGCAFCASGLHGLRRNLSAGEILAQCHAVRREMGQPLSHIVLMGMGEPLDNYENVLRFLRLASCPEGLCIGQRRFSLSTCGLVPQIERLRGENLGLTLSVSLHAPNDVIRSRLMPVNRRWPIAELLAVCKRYAEGSSRRVSFEYALFRDVNDSAACARELVQRLRGMLCHVNLIPGNPVPERGFCRSTPETVRRFAFLLGKGGVHATVRRSLGCGIDAACGQLRNSRLGGEHIEFG
ncbi:MAG: 23S rRNA (adenine(2503)-C(2))-methyltransferase RlmN [Oscillospiraceae bacterium]|jgi:23S rRNA (adenine2503-C2)-methyltransferase|nr:23S rRNA (adenine(2503)-C(2))-methyltransferase RlmN [Oscillospiraceae bacterium]